MAKFKRIDTGEIVKIVFGTNGVIVSCKMLKLTIIHIVQTTITERKRKKH